MVSKDTNGQDARLMLFCCIVWVANLLCSSSDSLYFFQPTKEMKKLTNVFSDILLYWLIEKSKLCFECHAICICMTVIHVYF